MLIGLDISHHQKPASLDWQKLGRAGSRFAIARATYGVKPDATFQRHVRKAIGSGQVGGSYHFLRYNSSQPAEAQAEAFLEALEPVSDLLADMLPPALDLEDNRYDEQIDTAADRRKYRKMVNTWLRIVEKELGQTCIIYTRANFFDDAIGDVPGFGIRPLWVAHYTSRPSPNIPKAWDRHTFWQFTEHGRLDGFSGRLDINRFEGDESDLARLVKGDLKLPAQPGTGDDDEADPYVAPLGSGNGEVHIVNTLGLSIRSEPRISDQTWMATLPVGQGVEVVDRVDDRWSKVRTEFNERELIGHVATRHLRASQGDAVENLVVAAAEQWLRFKQGKGHEAVYPYYKYVGEMWQGIGFNRDGRDRKIPWSAAAICWFVRQAGDAYDGFEFSQRHSTYINAAIGKKDVGKGGPFWGYRLGESKPEVGDIVCQWRKTKVDYDHAAAHSKFSSHTDIVVAATSKEITTIGGNVAQSVAAKTFRLDEGGFLRPERRLIALMKNRLRDD